MQDLYIMWSTERSKPRKHVPDHADRTAPTGKRELVDHTYNGRSPQWRIRLSSSLV